MVNYQQFIQSHSPSTYTTSTETTISNQQYFTIQCNPSFGLEVKQKNVNEYKISAGKSTTPNSIQQIEAEYWEYAYIDPVGDDKEVVSWDHTSFDPAKEDERTQCGDQISVHPAVIQKSLYTPEVDQIVNQEIMTRINKRVLTTQLVGIPIYKRLTNTCVIHDFGIVEIQDILINYQLEKYQYPENISIGGRLYRFIDALKLIGADSLITKGTNTFLIDTQAQYILEINITNIMKIRSKEIKFALGKLIMQELQQDIIEEESFSLLKWADPCFAIPKSVQGK
ncbi:MAG: hypothetical protein EZS28_036329 [Streblomastix strix]|uniref:Uncharacterized protein n=1 Tax=Streblomastix strix TaxID=222440 RepID=A0A5J4UEV3_9EUKA|nr:MAG: hypothetical protein EZS28_036329 [Streblomastix strix]